MATKVNRSVTREDISEAVETLSTLVDSKLNRVIDKVDAVREAVAVHTGVFQKTTDDVKARLTEEVIRIDAVHTSLKLDIESLKRYRWVLVGAVAVILFLVKYFGPAIKF